MPQIVTFQKAGALSVLHFKISYLVTLIQNNMDSDLKIPAKNSINGGSQISGNTTVCTEICILLGIMGYHPTSSPNFK